jgi:8-oxo-dGTP diphosphatase
VTRRPPSRTKPRRIGCPRCGFLIYDYPRPCAGMLVVKDDRVLLLRRAHPPRVGWLDVPGGFLEAGESLETGARRELREETGLTLGRVEPLAFHWDEYWLRGFGRFPTMNWYFVGDWRGGEPVASDDAADARWVPVARLPAMRARFSWRHMTALFAELRRWMEARRSKAGRPGGALTGGDPVTRSAARRRTRRSRAG